MSFIFPKIYPILDSSYIPQTGRQEFLEKLGGSLAAAGVTLLEYRHKNGGAEQILADAAILRATLALGKVKLILDDRADLVQQAGFDGAHVDSGDISPADARKLLGPEAIIGTFGGSEAMIPGILSQPASYFSLGPVFPTTTKQVSKAPIGPEGVKRLRAEAGPDAVLVGVAGITLETAPQVLAAGATTVAVSAAIFKTGDPAAEFRKWKQLLG